MERNLALELVRVMESGAIAAAYWVGKGDKLAADKAAVDAIRAAFEDIAFSGEIVIGEGEKDEAPMLYTGEKLGTGTGPQVDIAIDPLEGTTLTAKGLPGAMCVLAAGPKGALLKVPGTYMEQIAVGPEAKGVIDVTAPLETNMHNIAKALNKPLGELCVALLERPRHEERIAKLRALGCRLHLLSAGSLGAGLATCLPESPIDVYMGADGAPEAVIMAAGLQCYGGDMQAQLRPHNEKATQDMQSLGHDEHTVFTIDAIAQPDNLIFAATGVTSGDFLEGVLFTQEHIITHSIAMRSQSKTLRTLITQHPHKR